MRRFFFLHFLQKCLIPRLPAPVYRQVEAGRLDPRPTEDGNAKGFRRYLFIKTRTRAVVTARGAEKKKSGRPPDGSSGEDCGQNDDA